MRKKEKMRDIKRESEITGKKMRGIKRERYNTEHKQKRR